MNDEKINNYDYNNNNNNKITRKAAAAPTAVYNIKTA